MKAMHTADSRETSSPGAQCLRCWLAVVILLLILATTPGWAQDGRGDDAALRSRIAELSALATPTADEQAELTDLQSVLTFDEQAVAAAKSERDLAEKAKLAADLLPDRQVELQAAQDELKQPVSLGLSPQSEEATAAELRMAIGRIEAQLQSAQSKRESASQNLKKVESEQAVLGVRLASIPEQVVKLRTRSQEVQRLLAALPTDSELSAAQKARKRSLLAESAALDAEIAELEQELETGIATEGLRELVKALAQAQYAQAERVRAAWQAELDTRRTQIAAREAKEADTERREADRKDPVVRKILDENAALAKELVDQVAERQAAKNKELERISTLVTELTGSYEQIQQQIDRVGLNDVIGLRLHALRGQLLELELLDRSAAGVRGENKQAQSRSIELQSEGIPDVDAKARQLLGRPTTDDPGKPDDPLLETVVAALQKQEELRVRLRKAYDDYSSETLFPLQGAYASLAILVDEFLQFIDERLLWIRNTHPLNFSDIANLGGALLWLVDGENWGRVIETVRRWITERPAAAVGWILPFLLLLALRRRCRREFELTAGLLLRASTDRFGLTLRAATAAVLIALIWPSLLFAFARILSGSGQDFVAALSASLARTSLGLFILMMLWQIARPGGLGEKHFRWDSDGLQFVQRQLRWFIPVVVLSTTITSLTAAGSFQKQHDSLGRLVYCVTALAMAVFLRRVLSPGRGILKSLLAKRESGWLDRLRPVWLPILWGTPAALTLLACLGFLFTARMMLTLLALTCAMALGAMVIQAMLMRWLFVARRRMAIEKYRRRREAERQAAADAKEAEGSEEAPAPEDIELGVEEVSAQTTRLVRSSMTVLFIVGLLGIWAQVLPALGMLEQYPVWMPAGSTTTVAPNGEVILPPDAISISDILKALVTLFLTIAVSRNIPGVLEIGVLQRLPLTPGSRYAIRTLTRYALMIIGIMLVFSAVGLSWGKVQWLVAAVSVGLGFGLQEIFANFVSGIIILTERPVGVGDTVTIGDISGVVSRIQMRATTVTDWDRKELIIPNKEFITGQVTNWNLSSAVLRLRLVVGIAYGSDTALAKRLLLQVAAECPAVLESPSPMALFMEFGDSTLNFELRAFIDDIENFSLVRDRLNTAIDQAFRAANIEIAFPQRDLHIRSSDIVLPGGSGAEDQRPQE